MAESREPRAGSREERLRALACVAREFSPRVEVHPPDIVLLDVGGLGRLLGDPATIGAELRRAAADKGLAAHVALAGTQVAALLLARARAGLTVVAPGEDATAVAALPLGHLLHLVGTSLWGVTDTASEAQARLKVVDRWGLKTAGDLAALPRVSLSARLGQQGLAWQRAARGEDWRPLVGDAPEEPFEESLELEWPVEGLEPLSFVLGRLFEALAARLEARDRAAAVLHTRLRLVSRETFERHLELPSAVRDPRVLRTLVVLDLESHPVPAGIDAVTVAVDVVPGRILQGSLLARALPTPEKLSTLLARLTALMGERRAGSASLVDSYRPGGFVMTTFAPAPRGRPRHPVALAHVAVRRATLQGGEAAARSSVPLDSCAPGVAGALFAPASSMLPAAAGEAEETASGTAGTLAARLASNTLGIAAAVRRFRIPVPARVNVRERRPARVTTDRRGLAGGWVETAAGPWRTSGDWWVLPEARLQAVGGGARPEVGWNRDEWDVALSDGALYRLYRDRDRDRWFVDGILD